MHGVDKAAVLLLAPAIAHGLSGPPDTASEGHAVVSRLDTGAVFVQFQAPCAGCEHDPWPIDLVAQSTSGVCEDVTVSVNGRDLDYRWHDNTSWGSGAIPANPSHYYRDNGDSVKWQSRCMTPPFEAPSERGVHVLTVLLNNDTSSLQDHVGFTISFTISDQIEMRQLSEFPLGFSDESEWERWAYSDNAEGESRSQIFQHQKREKTILGVEIPADYPTKKFVRNCAISFLIILVIILAFRTIRRSTAFRRRRRDIASRHEERRARRAYKNAARRLRWRQWWEGNRSNSDTRGIRSSHLLAELQHPTTNNHPSDHYSSHHGDHRYDDVHNDNRDDYDSSSFEDVEDARGGGMMQAEILGLRRVLEYVGELVGNESSSVTRRSNRSRSRSRPPPRYDELHHSPRASTMFSLDTGSLVTLDTTDSETAPPSYHA
ncbi:hypothetical protein PISL3812_06009 [Talaromyces islandicus]|uniref:Uncharacterized protein n=1 Tax=Talaromyces islandicus TaxID=28573 RepID=A0A0U1M088_TALIS|nr:hypothetical protein PISL3812_06009 [Talaromyces islandicus]